jgi:carboxymethylenebutenolidase
MPSIAARSRTDCRQPSTGATASGRLDPQSRISTSLTDVTGPYALAAAARYPDRIAAAASFYGTWLVSEAEESPHLSLSKVKGELYIACAEHDKLAPLPMVEELRTLFGRAGTAGEIELYPGVHHGFAFPQRWCYDKPAAERHWERLIALYRRRLG